MRNYIKILSDKRILNSFWVFSEKFISLVGLVFVVSAVAQYVGPSVYGQMTFAGGVFLLVKTLSQLGLDQLYFKYLSMGKPYACFFLKNSMTLISGIYFFLSILVFLIFFNLNQDGLIFFIAYFIAYYFSAIDLFHTYNEANLLSKYNTIAIVLGLILSLLIRWFGVYFDLNYIFLVYSIIIFTLFPVFVKYFIYRKNKIEDKFIIKNQNHGFKYKKYMFFRGSLLSFSILIGVLNLQVATYFLGYEKAFDQLGLYSIAFTMAGAWCIVPTTIMISYFPKIFKINVNNNSEYILYVGKLFKYIFSITFFIGFVCFYLGPFFIDYLYGVKYYQSILLFKYILVGQVFWVFSFFFIKILVKFNQNLYLLKRSILCLLINLFFSIFLYKEMGVVGVALSYLISEVAGFIFMFFNFKLKLLEVFFSLIKVRSN